MFLQVCNLIQFPVALEKTFWGDTIMVFLGMLLDTEKQLICIPMEKLIKASNWVEFFLSKKNKKATVHEFQKLCGILNFLCRCIVPGRAFLRRLYVNTTVNGKMLKPHHHIRISEENRLDLLVWKNLLENPLSHYGPFMDYSCIEASVLDMYSDASRNYKLGFGAYCSTEWTFGQCENDFCNKVKPSIEYLELFGVLVGVLNWIKFFKNRRIILFCDKESVVHMINKSTSNCKNCMVLIRLLVAEGINSNVRIFARHVGTKENGKADALSRLDWNRFWKLGGNMNSQPTPIPDHIWPFSKIWRF